MSDDKLADPSRRGRCFMGKRRVRDLESSGYRHTKKGITPEGNAFELSMITRWSD
jgi:hypothetical protein